MPAPAVIPALIAYVKVVAVKTLVVGIRSVEALAGQGDALDVLPDELRGRGQRSLAPPAVPPGSQGRVSCSGSELGSAGGARCHE